MICLREKTCTIVLLLTLAFPSISLAYSTSDGVIDLPDHSAGLYDTHDAMLSGAAILPSSMIENFVRQVIAKKLNADVQGTKIRFQTKTIKQEIKIPDHDVVMRDILRALGIQKSFVATLSPIDTAFSLPASALDLRVSQPKAGRFDVVVKWKIDKIMATSESMSIFVPKGLFEKNFTIQSNPVWIGLKDGSSPIQVELKLQVFVAEGGTKLKLVSFNTNLKDTNPVKQPRFSFSIGPLTIDQQNLNLQIESNGQILQADEPAIRAELQRYEQEFTETLRSTINDEIQGHFTTLAKTFEKAVPFKLKVSMDTIANKPNSNPTVANLTKGIDTEFLFSALEYSPKLNLFTAQIASHVSFDGQCLFNQSGQSSVNQEDLQAIAKNKELGMIIYGAWLQKVINSAPMQKRIRDYYDSEAKAPGVDIGADGVKVYVNQKTKTLDAVFNLSIDIKKTALSKTATTWWKRTVERVKKHFGDHFEYFFGTGKRVIIPVEVHFEMVGYEKNANGQNELIVKSTLPFQADGTLTNTYGSPSNIEKLTGPVRKEFMNSIESTFKEVIPAVIRIPVPDSVAVQGVDLNLKRVLLTPSQGLLFTADLSGGEK